MSPTTPPRVSSFMRSHMLHVFSKNPWRRWRPVPSKISAVTWSDSSCAGWGAITNGRASWGPWKFPTSSKDLFRLELMAAEKAIIQAVENLSSALICIHIDNEGAAKAAAKMRCSTSWGNSILKRISRALSIKHCRLLVRWVPSESQKADFWSRIPFEDNWDLDFRQKAVEAACIAKRSLF